MLSQEQAYNLMVKQLAKQSNEEEELQLQQWLNSNDAHKELFKEVQSIWQQSSQEHLEVDVDAAWSKVNKKTQAKVITLPYLKLIKYAAVVAAFAILGVWAVQSLRNPITTIQTAANEIKKVELPDGSTIWLHEYSNVTYSNNLEGSQREIQLNGLVFFDVKRDETRPFIIHTPKGSVQVLGTSFEVSAYKNESFERVTVKTGKVKYENQTGSSLILMANQECKVDKTGKLNQSEVKAEELVSWTKLQLDFNDETLDKAIEKVSRFFHVIIQLANKEVANCHFTGSFKEPTLKEVLDAICQTLSLQQDKKGNTIILSGKGCLSKE
jgi:transmembrane sensor